MQIQRVFLCVDVRHTAPPQRRLPMPKDNSFVIELLRVIVQLVKPLRDITYCIMQTSLKQYLSKVKLSFSRVILIQTAALFLAQSKNLLLFPMRCSYINARMLCTVSRSSFSILQTPSYTVSAKTATFRKTTLKHSKI